MHKLFHMDILYQIQWVQSFPQHHLPFSIIVQLKQYSLLKIYSGIIKWILALYSTKYLRDERYPLWFQKNYCGYQFELCIARSIVTPKLKNSFVASTGELLTVCCNSSRWASCFASMGKWAQSLRLTFWRAQWLHWFNLCCVIPHK